MNPNFEALIFLLKSCKSTRHTKQVHTLLITNGLLNFNFATPFMWNTLIMAYSQSTAPHKTFSLYTQMLINDIHPNNHTFPSLIKASPTLLSLRTIHGHIIKHGLGLGLGLDDFIQSSLIQFYGDHSEIEDAHKVFNENFGPDIASRNTMLNACFRNADIVSAENMFNQMPHRDVVSWTTMVNGFTKNKQYKKVMDFFGLMLGSNVRPNEATLVSVLSAMANLSCLDEGQACHGYVVRNHLNLSANMGTALIDMYAKCGCINEAMQVFSMVNVRERGICTWNAAIMALATHGLLDQALELYELMQKAKVRPNSVTFVGALSACARGGLVDKGLEIFGSMGQLHGVQPRMEHYGCMVNLLGRAGLMDRALELIKDMPFEPDCSVWGALLGACSVQGDVGLGEVIGLCAIEAQPMHCGRYVILSNIYATAGRWAEAAEMREMMAKRGIKKVVGWSRIWQVA